MRLGLVSANQAPHASIDADYLRWWIEFDVDMWSQGVSGLGEFARHARTYWEARRRSDVALFHYDDMWSDLES